MNNQPNITPSVLSEFPIVHQQPVAWGELDALNHVNNAVYYRYMESARIEYLYQLDMFGSGQVLVLAQSSCHYLRPVYFPDTLLIGVRCKKLGSTSMAVESVFYSQEQQAVVATGDAVMVQLDKDAKNKLPWSEGQRQRVMSLESEVSHTPES